MVCVSKLSLLSLLSLVIADAAPEVSNSPTDVELQAKFDTKISGEVSFFSNNGLVEVSVDISGLPTSGGPFMYHIHQKPVPANGNCTATLAHFNPYNGTADGATDALKELGDLSGKHGKINGTSYQTTYIDEYLSLNPDDPAYFGGLSVVVHLANNSRLACANITSVERSLSESATSLATSSDASSTSEATSGTSSTASVESVNGSGLSVQVPGMAIFSLLCAFLNL